MDQVKIRFLLCLVASVLVWSSRPGAQRELHWSRIDVDAFLEADGTLRVTETQTMVFTGDWNGGERRFDIRPRQRLALQDLARGESDTWRPLSEDSDIDDRDEYAWTDRQTLRWRSRLASDPPFANSEVRYRLRYDLANILVADGADYVLDHDFLFADREGSVETFSVRLQLAPEWQPKADVREIYSAEHIEPGRGFVLTVPLRHSGDIAPSTWDTSRSPALVAMVATLTGMTGVLLLWFFVREAAHGRFAPLATPVDDAWLRAHVLNHPAEVVGAAWDEEVGSAEVVALLARLVGEGKLESKVNGSAMTLNLMVDRGEFTGYERTLIDRLFFNGRTTTSTDVVKQHYRAEGMDPARDIKNGLDAEVERVMPGGRPPLRPKFLGLLLYLVGAGLLFVEYRAANISLPLALAIGVGALVVISMGGTFGMSFQRNIQFGRRRAFTALLPAILTAGGVAWFLWAYVGPGFVEVSNTLAAALAAIALSTVVTTTNVMRSRRPSAAIAFRKILGAGREYFSRELVKQQPALRDEWMPWILAFGLGPQVDDWSARHESPASSTSSSRSVTSSTITSSAGSSASSSGWGGFSGGRSGGAGGGAAWTTAASSLAAGVAPPSSSSSGGGSSSSSSSSGGSSGGGGGGGW